MNANDLLRDLLKFDDTDLKANRAGKYSKRQRVARYKFAFGLWAYLYGLWSVGVAFLYVVNGHQIIVETFLTGTVASLPALMIVFLASNRNIQSVQAKLLLHTKHPKPHDEKDVFGGRFGHYPYWFAVKGESFPVSESAFYALQAIEHENMIVYYSTRGVGSRLLSIEIEPK